MHEYWNVLGLDERATEQELKDRYRQLVKQWHPDRFANDPHRQAVAEAKLKVINMAYRAVRNYRRMAGVGDTFTDTQSARGFRAGPSTNRNASASRSANPSPVALFRSEMMLTYLPLIVFTIFFTRQFEVIPFAAFWLTSVVLVMTWTIMMWDVAHNRRVPASRRVLWIVLLIVVAAVSAPIYYHRYVRPRAA
jgi:hypothetical protein